MAVRRPLTRSEARAQTRDEIFLAAKQLFMAVGYEGTTVARIAEDAGRTQGAIYSNFAGKDELALEVIKHEYLAAFADLAVSLSRNGRLDAKLKAFIEWWEALQTRQEFSIFVAEYALAIRRRGLHSGAAAEAMALVRDSISTLIAKNLELGDDAGKAAFIEQATDAIVATAVGVAIGYAGGLLELHPSSDLLARTIRMWAEQAPST